jgi:ADP-ribose pyrophosphatase YjhB (NUDIX family)
MTDIEDLFKGLGLNDDGDGQWITNTNSKKIKKKVKSDDIPYSDLRAGVILKKNNKFLLVRGQNTYDSEGKWGFPKGHVEKEDDGDLIKTASREVREETDIEINYKAFNKDDVFREDKLILYVIDADEVKELISIPKEFRKANEEIKKIGWFTIDQMKQSLKENKPLDKMNSPLRKWLRNQK